MASGFAIGYINSTILLLLFAGACILIVDVRGYRLSGMDKERKASSLLGWLNITLGMICLIVNYWYQHTML